MNRPTTAQRWQRVAVKKTLQAAALKAENQALVAQVAAYKEFNRELDAAMHFAGRVDYTGFVTRIRTVLVKVKKWERTENARQHANP